MPDLSCIRTIKICVTAYGSRNDAGHPSGDRFLFRMRRSVPRSIQITMMRCTGHMSQRNASRLSRSRRDAPRSHPSHPKRTVPQAQLSLEMLRGRATALVRRTRTLWARGAAHLTERIRVWALVRRRRRRQGARTIEIRLQFFERFRVSAVVRRAGLGGGPGWQIAPIHKRGSIARRRRRRIARPCVGGNRYIRALSLRCLRCYWFTTLRGHIGQPLRGIPQNN